MTSKACECFVYITLPRETDSVTAGKFVMTKDRRGNSYGRFIYGRKYLARQDAVDIDPAELKLSNETYETVRLGGMFGVIRDAAPDFWGRRLSILDLAAEVPEGNLISSLLFSGILYLQRFALLSKTPRC